MESPGCEPLITKTKLRKMADAGWDKTSENSNDERFILLQRGQTESILITRSGKFLIFNSEIVEIHALPVDPKHKPTPSRCTCHERDWSYVCDHCFAQGHRGHMQKGL